MKDESIQDAFYVQIQREINRVERKQEINRALYYMMRIAQIGLTGYITYLSGAKEGVNTNLILPIGVFTTSITAIETLFKFDSKKDVYSLLLFDLRAIRAEFIFHWLSEKIDENIKTRLFEKYIAATSSVRNLMINTKENKEKNKSDSKESTNRVE